MLLQSNNQRPFGFVVAKWISIVAVAATPLMFVVAAIKQNVDTLCFAIAFVIAIPLMAALGYWFCLFVYSGFQNALTDDHMDLFPSNWSSPFRLLNTIHHQTRSTDSVFALIFLNIFIVAWSGFLLVFVIAGIVLGLQGKLRG